MERKFKGTPGPWIFKATGRRRYIKGCPTDGSSEVCEVNELWVKNDVSAANAHLIASSPVLLTELERHCKKCEKKKKLFDTMNGTETLKYSCEKCSTKTALDKAYGIP